MRLVTRVIRRIGGRLRTSEAHGRQGEGHRDGATIALKGCSLAPFQQSRRAGNTLTLVTDCDPLHLMLSSLSLANHYRDDRGQKAPIPYV